MFSSLSVTQLVHRSARRGTSVATQAAKRSGDPGSSQKSTPSQ